MQTGLPSIGEDTGLEPCGMACGKPLGLPLWVVGNDGHRAPGNGNPAATFGATGLLYRSLLLLFALEILEDGLDHEIVD
jgi:hypothetical protein